MTIKQLDRDVMLEEIQKFVVNVLTISEGRLSNITKAEMICYLESVLHTSVMQRINHQRDRVTAETLN